MRIHSLDFDYGDKTIQEFVLLFNNGGNSSNLYCRITLYLRFFSIARTITEDSGTMSLTASSVLKPC